MYATVRAGKHSVLWGESLFFGTNAIAGGQQPFDVVKLLSVPSTQFKEAIRPVPAPDEIVRPGEESPGEKRRLCLVPAQFIENRSREYAEIDWRQSTCASS